MTGPWKTGLGLLAPVQAIVLTYWPENQARIACLDGCSVWPGDERRLAETSLPGIGKRSETDGDHFTAIIMTAGIAQIVRALQLAAIGAFMKCFHL